MAAAIRIASSTTPRASRSAWRTRARAAASAKLPPEPMAQTPSSGSMTSPVPETISELSRSATTRSASRRRSKRSVRQSFESSTAARRRFPFTDCSLASKRSKSVSASAPAPAKPARTRSWCRRRTLRAFDLSTVCPTVTCPSPPRTTRPRWRTDRIVVPCTSSSRVRAVIGVHQAAQVDVRVALRRRQARVAEQLLDGAQVGAGPEQVRGEGVAERVRRRARRRAGGGDVARHQPVDAAWREAPAGAIAEHSAAGYAEPGGRARRAIALERAERRTSHRHDPFLAPLAEDAHRTALDVEAFPVESGELRHPQPGRVEQLEDGAMAPRAQRSVPRHAEEPVDVVEAQMRGQRPAHFRRRDTGGGIVRDSLRAGAEAEEAAYGGQLARDRAPLGVAVKRSQPAPDGIGSDRGESVRAGRREKLAHV